MGLKLREKFDNYFRDSYFQKYGDRITSAQGTVISAKVEEKSYLIYNKLTAELIIKPDMGKGIIKGRYKAAKWFKKPEFIQVSKGNKVMLMGLKGEQGKKDSEFMVIQNVLNFTTKRDQIPVDHSQFKRSRQQTPKMYR